MSQNYYNLYLESQKKIKLMRQLGQTGGFYQYFFDQLSEHRNQMECFNHCNTLYYEYFGEYRYTSYHSFRQKIKYFLKRS